MKCPAMRTASPSVSKANGPPAAPLRSHSPLPQRGTAQPMAEFDLAGIGGLVEMPTVPA